MAVLLSMYMVMSTTCTVFGSETVSANPGTDAAEVAAEAAMDQTAAEQDQAAGTADSAQPSTAEAASAGKTATDQSAAEQADEAAVPYWAEDSAALCEILSFAASVTDESSESFLPVEDRIAVFDFDGTLFGELFPTYFDNCLFLHRVLHDESFQAPEDVKEYAKALEDALVSGQEEPESPRSTAQMEAECFAGMPVEEYRDYVRDFMAAPAGGFKNMTYGEAYYKPMTALVKYLAGRGFKVFISSGSERAMVRELIEGTLDEWIPAERVIGSTFSLMATGQGETAGRSYSFTPEDQVLMEGNLVTKNQKTNKVFSIVDEIGQTPVLVFGNSSGDLSMAEYCVRHGGQAYMLLCDDTDRDYGNIKTAEKFRETCEKSGFKTVSMKDEFETIYGENVKKTDGDRTEGIKGEAGDR